MIVRKMMLRCLTAVSMLFSVGAAQAALVQFNYSGADLGTVSANGFLIIDDALFDGTSAQFLNQSLFTSFGLTLMDSNTNETHTYNTANLNTGAGDNWRFDSATNPAIPAITGFQGLFSTGFYGTLIGFNTGIVRLDHPDNRTWRVNGAWTFAGPAVAAVPVPAALPLLAGGLGLMGLIGWRRKRKAAAA